MQRKSNYLYLTTDSTSASGGGRINRSERRKVEEVKKIHLGKRNIAIIISAALSLSILFMLPPPVSSGSSLPDGGEAVLYSSGTVIDNAGKIQPLIENVRENSDNWALGPPFTIKVGAGTYREGITIYEDNSLRGLRLLSADSGVAEIRFYPAEPSSNPTVHILADGVTIEDFRIVRVSHENRDINTGVAEGIRVSASNVSVDNNTVVGREFETINSLGILVVDDGERVDNVNIRESSVTSFAAGVSVIIYGHENISNVHILKNHISGNSLNGVSVATRQERSPKDIEIRYNTISGSPYGLYILGSETHSGLGDVNANEVKAHYNNIENNRVSGALNEGENNLSATYNWWGDPSGPSGAGPGTGDAVSENVDYTPWLEAPWLEMKSVAVQFSAGWNLFSLPLQPENALAENVFAGLTTFPTIYGWTETGYDLIEPRDNLEVGQGYWVKVPQAENVTVYGLPLESFTLQLDVGWNLSGIPLNIAPIAAGQVFEDVPTIYGWSDGYYTVEPGMELEVGDGYWIYSERAENIPIS